MIENRALHGCGYPLTNVQGTQRVKCSDDQTLPAAKALLDSKLHGVIKRTWGLRFHKSPLCLAAQFS